MAHIDHRDGNPRNLELSNIDLVADSESCPHEQYELEVKFNSGYPAYVCGNCHRIVGLVPVPDEFTDPVRALTDVFDLLEELHSNWEPQNHLTVEEIATQDARYAEAARRVAEITGEDR